jgi:energy-coupling factor transporter ATP-binding protein EcfA2
MSTFQKATKQQLKARIGLAGPTGGGKTYSALVFATALVEKTGGRIAVIDTENGRARAYSDKFDFDVVELDKPYSPQRYVDLINAAHAEGYEVVVVDSLSHAWADDGGVLDIKDKATERSRDKNSFAAWRHATPEHQKLVNALVYSPIHVIGTMRSKMAYVLEEGENGKNKVRKVGLQPVQREGLEYEFDLVLDVDLDHMLIASKSRCEQLADAVIRNVNHDPTETYKAARVFRDWLNSGEERKLEPWLDELCDTFGEGEVLDAINTFRAQANAEPIMTLFQVRATSEERVALLRSYLEDKANPVEAEPSPDGPDASGSSSTDDAVTRSGTPDESAAESPPVASEGRGESGDGDASASPDPASEAQRKLDAARAKQAAKKRSNGSKAKAQTELGEGAEGAEPPGSGTPSGASSSEQPAEGVSA